jgi:hypothetical protein
MSRRGCCCIEDAIAQNMPLHRGCCHIEDFVAHNTPSRRGFRCAEDAIALRIFLCTRYRVHYVNNWFSGKIQDPFLTKWRGILKIFERVLYRTKQIIKPSLIFSKGVTYWDIRMNL